MHPFSGGFEGCNQSSVNSQGCHLHVPWRENHRWNRCVFRVFCTKIRGFCRGDSWKWSASLQRIGRCGWRKSSWGKLRIITTGFFWALLNKISLHISPKKHDNEMKEWAKWAKDEISHHIQSHRERVVGQWRFANRWTVGAKRISNDLEWYSYMTYYIPLIFGISNMFIFNLTCADDPIWPHISTGLNHHQVH